MNKQNGNMPVDRNKIIRYKVIDRCLCDMSRTYTSIGLRQAVNAELQSLDLKPVSRRTIQNDLHTLQAEPFNIEYDADMLASHHYRYADTSHHLMLVHLLPANRTELQQAIDILFEHIVQADDQIPQYLWLLTMLQSIAGGNQLQYFEQYVSFEHNSAFAGNAHFATLVECVINQRPIVVRYQPYGRDATDRHLHPYHLKQYNNRWFLFAKEQGQQGITNLALDRIHNIRPWKTKFEPSQTDFTTYFNNMVGVSRTDSNAVEQITIRVINSRYPYIETKPFSDRQRIVTHTDTYHTITFPMLINNEFVTELLSYGADIEVLQPQHLRQKISDILHQASDIYSTAQKPCAQK